jgi:hypothetical protein
MVGRAAELSDFIRRSCPAASDWLDRALLSASAPLGMSFRAALASAPRRLGDAGCQQAGESPLGPAARSHWTLIDVTRLALLLRALELVPEAEHETTVLKLFEAGELGEQVSLLRTLGALPQPERFLQTGLQACRTNAIDVFEALVCDNHYPAAHFPELGFNQAVQKAIFLEVSVRRIEGLEGRISPELKRMSADYASERSAAGRPVPQDTSYILSYEAPAEGGRS